MEETCRQELSENLKRKSKILLSQCLDAYKKADEYNQIKTDNEPKEAMVTESENPASSSSSSSNDSTQQPKKDSNSTHSKEQETHESEDDREEWLHYYMFGKINEKQHGSLVDTVKNYLKVN